MRLSAVLCSMIKMLVVHVLPQLPSEDTRHSHTTSLTSKWQNNYVFCLRCNDNIRSHSETSWKDCPSLLASSSWLTHVIIVDVHHCSFHC